MIYEHTTLEVSKAVCTDGGHSVTPAQVEAAGGRCPGCGGDRFNASFVKRVEGANFAEVVVEAISGIARAALSIAQLLLGRHTGRWSQWTEYEVEGIAGSDLVAWSRAPAEVTLEAIRMVRLASAKADWKPPSRRCRACGTTYTVALSGAASIGCCSAGCLERLPPPSPPAPARHWIRRAIGPLLLLAAILVPVGLGLLKDGWGRPGSRREKSELLLQAEARLEEWLADLKAGGDGRTHWIPGATLPSLGPVVTWSVENVRLESYRSLKASVRVRASADASASETFWTVYGGVHEGQWRLIAAERQ
jgi:hypothetical protein